VALFRVRIATFQQCVSRSSGDNALISLMASPTVFSVVVPLQTNSNDNGLVLINETKSTSQKKEEIRSRSVRFPVGISGVESGH
jgi:hypothetical protein